MKKIVSTLLCLFCVGVILANSEYSRDAILIRNNGTTATIKCSGQSKNKKEAQQNAVMSIFDTYIFAGIEGLGSGKAILNESERDKFETYFHRLYEEGRYNVFVKSFEEAAKTRKLPNGLQVATVNAEVYIKALDKDLKNSKLIKVKEVLPADELEKAMIMPSIMVVPYKKDNETYKEVLDKNYDRRLAVGKVQDAFREKGIMTVDFEARYNAALRANEFEVNMADAFDTQLIKNSGAEVYVSVDINKNFSVNGNAVSISLKAYETATGNVLGAKQVSSDRYNTTNMDKLCLFAVKNISKSFLNDIAESLSKKATKGNTVALRVAIDGSSYKSLDDEVEGGDFGISDYIRSWLKKNAVNGVFHQQGKTDLAVIFDNVTIPNKNSEGEFQDATDFAVRLTRYLKKKGIPASNRIDGATIYITITDL